MNKTYKIVFNKTTGVFTAVAEFARSHTKATTVSATVPVTGSAFSLSLIALALMGTIASTSVEAATANTYFHVNATGQEQVGNDTNLDAIDGIGGAKGINSLAAGVNAQAKGLNSVALGHGAKADSDGSVALGNGSQTLENGGVAIGGATARGVETIAIGNMSQAAEQQSVAVGFWSEALNHQALALGSHAKAYESGSTAIGFASESYAVSATALGVSASANHEKSVALGAQSVADRAVITAGATAKSNAAVADNSVYALEAATAADKQAISATVKGNLSAVSVGNKDNTRQIINVAAGTEDSDAVNVSQLKAVANAVAKAADSANRENYFHVNTGAAGQEAGDPATNKGFVDSKGGALALNSLAAGVNAQNSATSQSAIAMGLNAKNLGQANNTVTIGTNATADNANSAVVIGRNAKATLHTLPDPALTSLRVGGWQVVIGNQAEANYDSVAIGAYAKAATDPSGANRNNVLGWATAVGRAAEATAHATSAFGNGATASKEAATAVGTAAKATGLASTAIGALSQANGDSSFASGRLAQANGNQSIASGYFSQATALGAVAVGSFAQAKNDYSVAIGTSSLTNEPTVSNPFGGGFPANIQPVSEGTVNGITYGNFANGGMLTYEMSVGSTNIKRMITNVSAGRITATSTDAINGSQLYIVAKGLAKQNYFHVNATNEEQAGNDTNLDFVDGIGGAKGINTLAAGINAQAKRQGDIAVGTNATAEGIDTNTLQPTTSGSALAIGTNSVATGIASTALGQAAAASKNGALALGSFSKASGNGSVALGRASESSGESSTALGTGSKATAKYSIASGVQSEANGTQSIAIGRAANSGANDATDTIAIGSASKASKTNAIALGTSSEAKVEGGVALGSGSVASIDKGVVGSNPLNAAMDATSSTWKSTAAAVSVGDVANGVTRQITSVAAGTADTDAVNVAQLKAVADTTKTEIQNVGFNLTTSASVGTVSGTTVEKIGTGETVTLDAGQNIQLTQAGNKITVATKDDVSFKNVNVTDTLTVGPVTINQTGKITGVTDGDISPTSTDAVNGSQLYAVKQEINNTLSNIKDTSASVTAGSDALTVTKGDTTKVGAADVTDYQVDLSQTTKDDIKKGVDAHDTVTNKGLTFAGDTGKTASQKLGSTVNVKGDKNITTSASGNTVNVALNDNIDVKSVKAGDTTVNNNGVTINNGAKGKPVSLTKNGLNNGGNRITNVAPGEDDTDAVNVSQLKNLDNKVNRVDNKLRAGIAQAGAMANIPQVTRNGASGLGVGVANYRGESALSVGYSRLSDNGKHIIKGSVAVDSRGYGMAGAGYMYQW